MKAGLLLLAAVTSVTAHATWQELWVGTEDKAGTCVRTVKDNSPIAGVTDAAMFCGRSPATSSGICEVKGESCTDTALSQEKLLTTPAAGSPLTVEMHQQPGDRSCSNPAIGGNHYGPVMVYMAKVSDAKTAGTSEASFFKVAEDGYTGTTASWGTEILNANCGKRAFTGKTVLPLFKHIRGFTANSDKSLPTSHLETI